MSKQNQTYRSESYSNKDVLRPSKGDRKVAIQQQRTQAQRQLRNELLNWDKVEDDLDFEEEYA